MQQLLSADESGGFFKAAGAIVCERRRYQKYIR